MNSIDQAEKFSKAARRTSPPCPVFTQASIAFYKEAQEIIEQRIAQLEKQIE
jgi:hypothetical protein